jgi:hypothetical protein
MKITAAVVPARSAPLDIADINQATADAISGMRIKPVSQLPLPNPPPLAGEGRVGAA